MVTHIAPTAFAPKTYCGRTTASDLVMVSWVTKAKALQDWHLDYMYCKRCKRKI